MPIQTSYPFAYTAGLPGQPYDLTPYQDVTADAATAIGFGLGLVLDSSRTPQSRRLALPIRFIFATPLARVERRLAISARTQIPARRC